MFAVKDLRAILPFPCIMDTNTHSVSYYLENVAMLQVAKEIS